jgi:hypothetical protein
VARDGVLTGGRVGGDSGYLLELRGRTREVRAAPNRAMVADRWVSPGGGGMATAAVRNAMRTAVARLPAWMRGGLMWSWVEESEGGEKRARARRQVPFEAEVGDRGGWGSGVRRRVEGKTGQREGDGVR